MQTRSTGPTDGTLHSGRNDRAASRLNTEANAASCRVQWLESQIVRKAEMIETDNKPMQRDLVPRPLIGGVMSQPKKTISGHSIGAVIDVLCFAGLVALFYVHWILGVIAIVVWLGTTCGFLPGDIFRELDEKKMLSAAF